jgi:predicted metal-binding protein
MDLSDRLPQSKKEQKRSAMAAKVKAALEADGYALRSEYVNNRTKLDFTCPAGHDRDITWHDFHGGSRCAECMGKVVTHERVKAAFDAEGYTLKSEYVRSSAKLDFTCPAGHDRDITWNSFNDGKRCRECAGKIVTHEQVKAAFEAAGYTLKSEYVNNHSKLQFTCPEGHNRSIRWGGFRNGRRCRECAGQVVTHEQVKAAFEAEGYTLKSEYVKNKAKLQFTCPAGHDRDITWSGFRSGNRCDECAGQVVTYEQVKAAFEAAGYTLKSEYVNNNKAKLKFTCSDSHDRSISWNDFQQGKRCRECAKRGYSPSLPGTLYYVRFELKTGWVYKIGITNLTVRKRFSGEKTPYTVIWQERYEDGAAPPEIEKKILRKHKKYRYKGNALKSGNTECFTHDVLMLDRDKVQLGLFAA